MAADESGTTPTPVPAMQNRTSSSKSPFVRSAANALVKWQVLDAETLDRAKQENKLIFLHIGYKACHCE